MNFTNFFDKGCKVLFLGLHELEKYSKIQIEYNWFILHSFDLRERPVMTSRPTILADFVLPTYSDLPNNCAANPIIFWEKTNLHKLIRTYTFIDF